MSNDPEVHAADGAEDEGRVSLPHMTPPAKVPTSQPAKVPTYPMSSMRTSAEGIAFITSVEGRGSDTDRIQSPGGRSGVTVGLGYDIYGRKANEIVSDLTGANIARANAEFLSGANNLRGPDADKFVRKNKNLIFLNSLQKQALLKKVIEKYEKKLKDNADFPVTQHQFDALVAFTYNSGGDLRVITRSLATGNLAKAEKDWMSRTHSKDPHHPHSPPCEV